MGVIKTGIEALRMSTAMETGAVLKGAGLKAGMKRVGKPVARSGGKVGAASNWLTRDIQKAFHPGRAAAFGTAAAIPIGMGAAIASEHPLQGAVNNAMDLAFSDPYLESQGVNGRDVDNSVLGHDVGFSDMFLGGAFNPRRISPFGLPSVQDVQDAFTTENFRNTVSSDKNRMKMNTQAMEMADRQAQIIGSRGGGDNEYWDEMLGLPYRPQVRRGPIYSSGDQVFGMYNKRHR